MGYAFTDRSPYLGVYRHHSLPGLGARLSACWDKAMFVLLICMSLI